MTSKQGSYMHRILIFGNSGAGKSTLAMEFAAKYSLPHLDLDTLAWEDSNPPIRKSLKDSALKIELFTNKNDNWIIEGCYADLLGLVIENATEVIFLNPGVETCIENCKSRPWEPHKYDSIATQNENLDMLLDWVREYPIRSDEFSLSSHLKLFNEYSGSKVEYKSNDRNSR